MTFKIYIYIYIYIYIIKILYFIYIIILCKHTLYTEIKCTLIQFIILNLNACYLFIIEFLRTIALYEDLE